MRSQLTRCVSILLTTVFPATTQALSPQSYDLVIYGGTSCGVAAAVQAVRMGKFVIVIEPSKHLGGLTSGGLGWTDSGSKAVIGGISREFYQRIKRHYDQPTAWKYEHKEQYGRYRAGDDAMWTFEPHVAERVFNDWLLEHQVPVVFEQRLDRGSGVAMTKSIPPRIVSIRMESGRTYRGNIFIDATYEGDLMAAAKVSYTTGRESNRTYNETLNGVQRGQNVHNHRFRVNVDPYVTPGDPQSGLLPGIDPGPYPPDGEADRRVQAYCFRMCMSNVPENRVPFAKPDDYDPRNYELLLRNFEAGDPRFPMKPDMMPNGKTDTNNNCAVSTDYIGQNYSFPEASYDQRQRIIRDHLSYQQGLMWTLANHPRVPRRIRERMSSWGLAKDEFTDTDNWPHQIYVREARRMVSDYVLTENDCRRKRKTPMPIGMGSYNMDSHNCMRYVTPEGYVQNEGDVQVSPGGAYQISYLSIVPKKNEASNLLVPVCISSSHIAYGSVRMEPVFMILGQSAATAAVLAIDDKVDVQDVAYAKLRKRLLNDRQVLEYLGPTGVSRPGIDPRTLPGIVLDDIDAQRINSWLESTILPGYIGKSYLHDGNAGKAVRAVQFQTQIVQPGRYEVRIAYTAHPNRATNVPVTIETAHDRMTSRVNQREKPPIGGT